MAALNPLIPDPNDPAANPAPLGSIQMPSSVPAMPPMLRPLVTSPRLDQENMLQGKINAFENPAPQQGGFWHRLGHIAAQAANVAGDIFAPETTALIPGSNLNRELQHQQNLTEIAGLRQQDRLDQELAQQQANQASEQLLRNAQIQNFQSEAAARAHPTPTLQHIETDQGIFAFNPRTNELTPLTYQGKPLTKSPAPKELTAENDLKNQILAAEQAGDQPTVKKLQKQLADLNPLGQQHINISLAGMENRENQQGNKQDAATRQAVFKAYQPALDSAERFNVMAKNYEDAVQNHDQQAMLSLLSNHLGMTMGLQKGARITRDTYREAEQSRPWLQGVTASFDKDGYLSGVKLSPEQMRQMVGLARDRYAQDVNKAGSEARYLGANDEGPDRTPSEATMRFYVNQAHGDINKAKNLAKSDGWTIK